LYININRFNLLSFYIGKPLNEEHIRWERIGYDMTVKTSTTFSNDTSYLHIKEARREDVGNFRCIADNRVANPTSRDVLLIVKCKSVLCMDKI
jgi:nephron